MIDAHMESEDMSNATGKREPSYIGTIVPYLRQYRRHGLSDGDSLMPQDARITRAIKTVYRNADERDRAYLDGGAGTGKQLLRLSYQIAKQAGMMACYLPIVESEEKKNVIEKCSLRKCF